MEKIVINGGAPLSGSVEISGTKNAATAIIIGTLLLDGKCVLENIPEINDVGFSIEILEHMGARVRRVNKTTYEIDSSRIALGTEPPHELVMKMRSSVYLLGAQLGKFGYARVSHPGGCDFGVRPIDQHIKGFKALGANVGIVEGGFYEAVARQGGLTGAQFYFDRVSVGATINIILAAARASRNTVIENAAREPHVVDLANFLNACGANISGAGTDVIKIKGVSRLSGCTYAIIPDMIEAGTFMVAAAATRGNVRINNVIPKHLESITAKLTEMGVDVREFDDSVTVSRSGELRNVNITTLPYPGLPTDMNPQMCVLMCLARDTGVLTEGVFEHRFKYTDELVRMGADITVDGRVAVIKGKGALKAASIKAVDLRAGAGAVIAGLAAEGRTEISEIQHIDRGYEDIVGKFRALGADIKKISSPDPAALMYERAN